MRHRIRVLCVTVGLLATSGLTVGPLSVGALAATVTVSQQKRSFSPKTIEITRGDTVKFANDDEFTHQLYVDSPSMTFESNEQNPGESVNLVFPTAGTFQVQCHIHPKMTLAVTVR